MSSTRVLVADANSTDGTPEIVLGFRDRLNVSVIRGGRPSVGRNQGAAQADSSYVLFLDADIELADRSLAFYVGNDLCQYWSYLHRPFATGMFMLFDRKKFWELGGFHEQILFAEDYRLSQQVERKRFAVVRGGVHTTNRRFKKMGHMRVGWLFLWTAMNYWNEKYFLRDHKYWASEPDSVPRA
jgi:glycosyltransferase involved in cell wall biosynthesis